MRPPWFDVVNGNPSAMEDMTTPAVKLMHSELVTWIVEVNRNYPQGQKEAIYRQSNTVVKAVFDEYERRVRIERVTHALTKTHRYA